MITPMDDCAFYFHLFMLKWKSLTSVLLIGKKPRITREKKRTYKMSMPMRWPIYFSSPHTVTIEHQGQPCSDIRHAIGSKP